MDVTQRRRLIIAVVCLTVLFVRPNEWSFLEKTNKRLGKYSPWKLALASWTFHYITSNLLTLIGLGATAIAEPHYHSDFRKIRKTFTALDAAFVSAMHISPKFVRDIVAILLAGYFLLLPRIAEDRMNRFHQTATIDGIRECWNKGRHPFLWNIQKILNFRNRKNIAIHRKPIPIPRRSDRSSIDCYLYFQGTAQQLRECRHVVVHYPGGGFIAMDPTHHECYLNEWAHHLRGVAIVSVDYRKAPEYKYPHGFNDAYDVYHNLVTTQCKAIGIVADTNTDTDTTTEEKTTTTATAAEDDDDDNDDDNQCMDEFINPISSTGPSFTNANVKSKLGSSLFSIGASGSAKVKTASSSSSPSREFHIALAGDSAGGNFCAAVCLRAIAEGERIPNGLCMAYPMLDCDMQMFKAASYREDYGRNMTSALTYYSVTPTDISARDEMIGNQQSAMVKQYVARDVLDTDQSSANGNGNGSGGESSIAAEKSCFESFTSRAKFFDDGVLPIKYCLTIADAYVPSHADTSNDMFLSPIRAQWKYLRHFPLTRIHVGECDPLIDDSRRFVRKLKYANPDCDVKLLEWTGMSHAYLQCPPHLLPQAHFSCELNIKWLSEMLSVPIFDEEKFEYLHIVQTRDTTNAVSDDSNSHRSKL